MSDVIPTQLVPLRVEYYTTIEEEQRAVLDVVEAIEAVIYGHGYPYRSLTPLDFHED